MNKQKELWNKLAKENSKYYINSDKGKGITREQFVDSGLNDYIEHIYDDDLIMHAFRYCRGLVNIVDLGCGIGRISEFMADDFDNVIGLDISGEMIREASKRLIEHTNIEFIETDGKSIPLEDDSVDIVFSYLVFQHIKEREIVEKNFKEVYRVLKDEGLFKVRIRSDKVDLNKWWGGVEYTEQSIGKLIKKIGFELVRTEPVGNYGFWLWLRK